MGRRSRRTDRTNYTAAAVILTLVLGLVAFVAFLKLSSNEVEVAEGKNADGCPLNPGFVSGQTVFLVDTTEPLNRVQRDFIANDIKVRILDLPQYHRVSIFAISADLDRSGNPLISVCTPRKFDPNVDSEFSTNVAFLQKQYEDKFEKIVLGVTVELLSSGGDRYSPILEVMQLAAINGLRKRASSLEGSSNLIIYSDLIHNSPSVSFYGNQPKYESFKSSLVGLRLLPNLDGIAVSIHAIISSTEAPSASQRDFWRELVADRGGRLVVFKYIPG